MFDTEQKSSKFLLEIITLVSSANNTVLVIVSNLFPGELHVSMYPSQRKIFLVISDYFTATFCLLLVKQDLNQSSDTPGNP